MWVRDVQLNFCPTEFEQLVLARLKRSTRLVSSVELCDLVYKKGLPCPRHYRRSLTVRMNRLISRLAGSGVELTKVGGNGPGGVSYSL
jgi:hypothetical protein